jgi:hypothetical protein
MGGTEKDARPAMATPVEEDPNAAVVCSSPPCFMHELDPTYLGYLGREQPGQQRGHFLAADWGGSVPDEVRLRAALRGRLEALGDSGPAACGGPEPPAQAVREALPRIHDDGLRRDLQELLGALERGGALPRWV